MKITLEIPDTYDKKEVQEAVDKLKVDGEVDKVNAVCFWLIGICNRTNATEATINQENVHRFGEQLGSWRIKVKKVK